MKSITKLVYLKMRDDLQVNNIAQRQVYHYLKDCDFDGHLKTVIDVYRRRRDVMAEAVRASFPEGTRVILPGGGLFMWVDLPEGTDALEMFDFVFQKNIAYVPGTVFLLRWKWQECHAAELFHHRRGGYCSLYSHSW